MSNTCNRYGLFDAPVPRPEQERLSLTLEALDQQMEDGAFLMDREKAILAGFINPYDDDTVSISVR